MKNFGNLRKDVSVKYSFNKLGEMPGVEDPVVRSVLRGVFYLSKRRAVYFGHKSIVHACDASEWVGMHSVCIKRHWPPLARPKPHFHSPATAFPSPHQSFPLFRRVDLVISTNVYSATGTARRIFDCKSVQTALEIIIKSFAILILKAVQLFTCNKFSKITLNYIFTTLSRN